MSEKFSEKDLMLAVSRKDCEKLTDLAAQNKSKKLPFSFKFLLKELTAEEIDEIWEELSKTVIEQVETTFVSNSTNSRESISKKTCLDVGLIVQAAIDLALAILDQSMPASQGLLHMIVFLNRNIFEIPNSLENLRNNISLLCEKMFHLDYLFQDHELITFNAVIYLLKRSLAHKVAKKVIKRVYALRSIIPKILKLGEVDANSTWNLFKKCATSPLYLSMPELLAQFHSQKKEAYVSKMLYNLYHPILWRFVKDPDGLICANTAQLFLDVWVCFFPLEDPDVKLVTTDLELNEQMLIIKGFPLDDFPIVRSVAVIGLCIAMSINWELFPEDMLKTYFKIIVNDLSCDSSSADVRCAVAKLKRERLNVLEEDFSKSVQTHGNCCRSQRNGTNAEEDHQEQNEATDPLMPGHADNERNNEDPDPPENQGAIAEAIIHPPHGMTRQQAAIYLQARIRGFLARRRYGPILAQRLQDQAVVPPVFAGFEQQNIVEVFPDLPSSGSCDSTEQLQAIKDVLEIVKNAQNTNEESSSSETD